MLHELIDGTYRQTNLPNESAEYLANRLPRLIQEENQNEDTRVTISFGCLLGIDRLQRSC